MNFNLYLYPTASGSFRICVMSGYRRDLVMISLDSLQILIWFFRFSSDSHQILTRFSSDFFRLTRDSREILARFQTDLQPIFINLFQPLATFFPLLLLLLQFGIRSKKIYLCIILVKSKMNNESTIQYLASYALTYLALSAIDRYCKK